MGLFDLGLASIGFFLMFLVVPVVWVAEVGEFAHLVLCLDNYYFCMMKFLSQLEEKRYIVSTGIVNSLKGEVDKEGKKKYLPSHDESERTRCPDYRGRYPLHL